MILAWILIDIVSGLADDKQIGWGMDDGRVVTAPETFAPAYTAISLLPFVCVCVCVCHYSAWGYSLTTLLKCKGLPLPIVHQPIGCFCSPLEWFQSNVLYLDVYIYLYFLIFLYSYIVVYFVHGRRCRSDSNRWPMCPKTAENLLSITFNWISTKMFSVFQLKSRHWSKWSDN